MRPAPAPRWRGPRWLLVGGLALAFALALGAGALFGATLLSSAQAASLAPGGPASGQFAQASIPGARGGQGQCESLTVSSVNGNTIVAKAADGSTVTIHTTSSTQYRQNDQSASASAVTAGARIHVTGTHNRDGSITATSIDVE